MLLLGRTRTETEEVVALAATGKLQIPVEDYPYEKPPASYKRLRSGDVCSGLMGTF